MSKRKDRGPSSSPRWLGVTEDKQAEVVKKHKGERSRAKRLDVTQAYPATASAGRITTNAPSVQNLNSVFLGFHTNTKSQKEYTKRNEDVSIVRNNFLNSSGEMIKAVSLT